MPSLTAAPPLRQPEEAERPPVPGTLLWVAPYFNHSGYGEEARGFLSALWSFGWRFSALSPGDDSPSFVESMRGTPMLERIETAMTTRCLDPVTAVLHLPGYAAEPVGGACRTIVRTMFETDGLPVTWVERLNRVDEVWVPSHFNAETFVGAGVTVPVIVVHGGVDADTYRPGLERLAIPGARGTTFLSVFEWSNRKAPDVLLRAWADAFGPDEDVSLVLRCFPRGRFDGDTTAMVEELVGRQLATLGLERPSLAPIVVVGAPLAPSEMPRLIASADVFVGVSRGEGWGRPLIEAMACGLPAIGTRWSGNLEFMTDDNSLLIEPDGLVEIDERMDLAFYRGQRWAEPSAAHLTECLRRVAADTGLRERLGSRARADVVAGFGWHEAASAADARLRELAASPPSVRRPTRARVRWRGDFYADTGFANVNRELCAALVGDEELDIEPVTAEKPPYAEDHVAAVRRIVRAHVERPGGEPRVEVRHSWPPNFTAPEKGKLVVMQPWEFGGVPADWVEGVKSAQEVWVPTSWVRDCYVRSGVPRHKVVLVPYGIDTQTFRPDGRRFSLKNAKAVRLLFVGGAIPRKGFDLLLDTYLESFGPQDDVCLVLKLFGSDGVYRQVAMDGRAHEASEDPRAPAIEIVEGRLTKGELASLYRACDVLVHPYRGEGFALPVAEAMACGLSTVVTDYGACSDYCDASTSWLVPARTVPVELEGVAASPAGFWRAEPDRESLRKLLRQAVTDEDARRRKGAAGRARVVEQLGVGRSAEIVRGRLRALVSGDEAPPPVPTSAEPGPSAPVEPTKGTDERIEMLAKLTSTALGKMQGLLQDFAQELAYLKREASAVPRGTNPVPASLLVKGTNGGLSIGFRSPDGRDAGYVGFEDVFRGSEEEIRRRLRFYVPLLVGRTPVLDVGCGRGEMLELLVASGIEAHGIDLDASMVDRAEHKGLSVEAGDCIGYLGRLEEGALGAVFSAQVIEHLDGVTLQDFLAESRRALRPGGLLVAETVNPHCAVARKNFWLDLTHKHPIFPEVAVLLCRQAGFSEATVVFPGGSGDLLSDLLTVPDYAVVAVR